MKYVSLGVQVTSDCYTKCILVVSYVMSFDMEIIEIESTTIFTLSTFKNMMSSQCMGSVTFFRDRLEISLCFKYTLFCASRHSEARWF